MPGIASFVSFKESLKVVQSIAFDVDPVHLTWNSYLDECAILLRDGRIFTWDTEYGFEFLPTLQLPG